MQFPTLEPRQRALLKIGLALLPMLAFVLFLYSYLKSQAAYAKAMNAIAEAAQKGENVHVQIAHFSTSDHATAAQPK